MDSNFNDNTVKFTIPTEKKPKLSDVITQVFDALSEKGYDPVNQLVGYIISGDPTYVTSHNNARSLIGKFERDEIIEFLLKHYIQG